MAVAIANFLQLEKSNKIMVLGDMFELGHESHKEHSALVDSLKNETDVQCFFVGKAFFDCQIAKNNFRFYDSFESFSEGLKTVNFDKNTILIKGSRGMALERTLDYIK